MISRGEIFFAHSIASGFNLRKKICGISNRTLPPVISENFSRTASDL